jgi:hypothetical protein
MHAEALLGKTICNTVPTPVSAWETEGTCLMLIGYMGFDPMHPNNSVTVLMNVTPKVRVGPWNRPALEI